MVAEYHITSSHQSPPLQSAWRNYKLQDTLLAGVPVLSPALVSSVSL